MVSHNIFFASTNVFMSEKTDINRLRHGTGRNLAQRTAQQNGAVAAAWWHSEPLPSEEFRGRMNLNMYVQLGRKDISDGCFAMRLGLAGLWSIISLRVIHSLVHDLAAPLAPHEVVKVASSKNPDMT